MKRIIVIIIILLATGVVIGQERLSVQMARTAMKMWPDSFMLENDKYAKWRYDQGVILKGIEGVWYATGDGEWFRYIQKSMDFYVNGDGSIRNYRQGEYNIDHVNNGKLLLLLYRVTGKVKYKKAVDLLRSQLATHPRTSEGGFWHKKIYPNQMWLDGLYMAQPFYAEYASLFHEEKAFNDITRQFVLMEAHARDQKTGLLYHGWDESKTEKWADPATGLSRNFWGRALGWFGMALVDALDHFPKDHQGRDSLIAILNRFATAVISVQDKNSGLWYDIVDQPTEPKNYHEASASCMLAYTIAKASRLGYIPSSLGRHAGMAFDGIIRKFIKMENGQLNLHGTVSVSGLGGKPYRDGSFEYYMSEPVIVNDPKGMGAFIKAAVELEMTRTKKPGMGKTVVLDYFYNNEWKKDVTGKMVRWHYTLNDKSNSGYSLLAHIFNRYGASTTSLEVAPDESNLQNASVYIIVDPDTEKETERPNFFQQKEIEVIKNWVKDGGVLVLLGNDAGNAEFTNFNILAGAFGMYFNEDSKNRVQNDQFEQGAVITPAGHFIFKESKKLYIKEYSSMVVKSKAISALKNGNDHIMCITCYGKGTVFAMGDPWIYNEYLDGRKLPADFQNYEAAEEWVKWLLSKAK